MNEKGKKNKCIKSMKSLNNYRRHGIHAKEVKSNLMFAIGEPPENELIFDILSNLWIDKEGHNGYDKCGHGLFW